MKEFTFCANDRQILVEMQKTQIVLQTTLDRAVQDIKELKDGLNTRVKTLEESSPTAKEWETHLKKDDDHERRIRECEGKSDLHDTQIATIKNTIQVWSAAIIAAFAVVQTILMVIFR